MKKLWEIALAGCLAAISVSPAWAWNRAGHMVTGAIAYDVLQKENPRTLAKVLALLREHPQYDRLWARRLEQVKPEDRDQALFMLAARWPDDIRDYPEYTQPKWHYIDFPYKPPGQPESVKTVPPEEPNAQVAFRLNVDVLQRKATKNKKAAATDGVQAAATDAEKAIALCWIFHLVGDVHQPLHTVSLFTTEFPAPEGDAGASKSFIRAEPDADPITLHRFWDDLVQNSEDTRDAKNRAIELRAAYPRAKLDPRPKQVSPADFAKWVQESFQSSITDVYRHGKVSGKPNRGDAPILPDDYARQVKPIAERHATLSGYRLADILTKVVP